MEQSLFLKVTKLRKKISNATFFCFFWSLGVLECRSLDITLVSQSLYWRWVIGSMGFAIALTLWRQNALRSLEDSCGRCCYTFRITATAIPFFEECTLWGKFWLPWRHRVAFFFVYLHTERTFCYASWGEPSPLAPRPGESLNPLPVPPAISQSPRHDRRQMTIDGRCGE